MDREWKHLKIVKDFFQIQEDGQMPEGSRLLLDFVHGRFWTERPP